MSLDEAASKHHFTAGIERDRLQSALLAAVAELAQEHDPADVLQSVCDTLVAASPHIRAAWLYLFERPGERLVLSEVYAAGARRSATRRARSLPVLIRATCPLGLEHDEQLMCFPLGEGTTTAGCLVVRVDRLHYLDEVGTDALHQFAVAAGVLLQQTRLRQRLRQLAEYDELTGLLNRSAVQAALNHMHAQAERRGTPYALVLLDIDHFKVINDHHGHSAGDRALAWCAQSLRTALRDEDWIGRWGGEEFLALLPGAEADEALEVAQRLRTTIADEPFTLSDRRIHLTVSGGVACYPLDGTGPGELLSLADAALYEAKDQGRNAAQRPTMHGRRFYTMASRIEEALRTDAFQPAYQPIIDLHTGTVAGHELLARLIDPMDDQPLEAEDFIDVASRRHLIHRIDHRMFTNAIEHLHLHVKTTGRPSLHFVNVSAALLRRPALIQDLIEHLRAQQEWEPQHMHPIVIEVTERDFIDPRQALEMLQPFIDLGVTLALDDFGSGYSSFRYLAVLPVTFLKIEGALVRAAPRDPKSRAIVRGIHDIAAELDLLTLAECVEDAPTAALMKELGIDLGQGFHFGKPELRAP